MMAAHVGASIVLGLWLATGERLLWFALRRIAYAARRGLTAVAQALRWALRPLPTPSCRPIVWLDVNTGSATHRLAPHLSSSGSAPGRRTLEPFLACHPAPLAAGWHPTLSGETS